MASSGWSGLTHLMNPELSVTLQPGCPHSDPAAVTPPPHRPHTQPWTSLLEALVPLPGKLDLRCVLPGAGWGRGPCWTFYSPCSSLIRHPGGTPSPPAPSLAAPEMAVGESTAVCLLEPNLTSHLSSGFWLPDPSRSFKTSPVGSYSVSVQLSIQRVRRGVPGRGGKDGPPKWRLLSGIA